MIPAESFSREYIQKQRENLGVPFQTKKGNSMIMQVVKQLFDVGELFSEV